MGSQLLREPAFLCIFLRVIFIIILVVELIFFLVLSVAIEPSLVLNELLVVVTEHRRVFLDVAEVFQCAGSQLSLVSVELLAF